MIAVTPVDPLDIHVSKAILVAGQNICRVVANEECQVEIVCDRFFWWISYALSTERLVMLCALMPSSSCVLLMQQALGVGTRAVHSKSSEFQRLLHVKLN